MIDLRSDTVTRPTQAMRRVMAEAEVGDDVFGDDPTVKRLEETAAALTGKEAALFVPSGTMANQIAVRVVCRPGDEILVERNCHLYMYEAGGAAANSGTQIFTLDGDRGLVPPHVYESAIKSETDDHLPRTKMIWIENTHNRAGGRIIPAEHIEQVRVIAKAAKLWLHCDGARLFNAAVAAKCSVRALSSPFDSLSLCLSKGLGAPIGSLLLGDQTFIRLARRARKVFGGGMRQVGIIAAAGLFALEHNVARLEDDHRRARTLADALAKLDGIAVISPDTNIVIARISRPGWTDTRVITELARANIHATSFGPQLVRFVTHLDIDDSAIEQTICTLNDLWQQTG